MQDNQTDSNRKRDYQKISPTFCLWSDVCKKPGNAGEMINGLIRNSERIPRSLLRISERI